MMLSGKKIKIVLVACALVVTGACATIPQGPEEKYSAVKLKEIGEKFLASGGYGEALKYLTLAEAKSPDDPKIQYSLARAYDERGLPVQAVAHYQKAIALKPDYSEAYNALGAYYAKQHQDYLAEDAFRKALANPFYETPFLPLFNLGLIYESKRDLEGALQQYQEAVRLQPNYGLAYFRMGLVLENLKRADEAKDAYAKAIEYYPDLVEAHLRFGEMSYTAGEIERALYSLSRVVKLAPNSSMAAEAKRYLEKLQSVIAKPAPVPQSAYKPSFSGGGSSAATGKVPDVEVLVEQDLARKESAPPKTSAPAPTPAPAKAAEPPAKGPQPSAPVPAPAEAPAQASAVAPVEAPAPTPTVVPTEAKAAPPAPAPAEAPEASASLAPAPASTPAPMPAPAEASSEAPEPDAAKASAAAAGATPSAPEPTPSAAEPAAGPEAAQEGPQVTATPPPAHDEKKGAISPLKKSGREVSSSYIVQVGSFLARGNAEGLQRKLQSQGFAVVVKTIGHQVLGSIYVVQLEPMKDSEAAGAALKKIEAESHLKPVLIRVPSTN